MKGKHKATTPTTFDGTKSELVESGSVLGTTFDDTQSGSVESGSVLAMFWAVRLTIDLIRSSMSPPVLD